MPKDSSKQGDTVPVQGDKQQRSLRMPHERDESADGQAGSEPTAKRVGTIAHADVAQGRVDTGTGPVLDKTYDKVREGASQPVKRKRK
jgi:hypothetical protein